MLVAEVLATRDVNLAGGSEGPGHPTIGVDVGTQAGLPSCGHVVTDDPGALFERSQVVIDFSSPRAIPVHTELAVERKVRLVIGTTGLTADHLRQLAEAARVVAVVQAANMSIGANLLIGLSARVVALLPEDYDAEIVEMHHRYKADSPSGTALAIGQAIAAARNLVLDRVAVKARDGTVGPRPHGSIGFATLRCGDVIGEHTVVFAGDGERVELTHRATSRSVFAKGAVRAALWSADQDPGLYSMRDVLGLGSI
jgi:4-hydroxy-tetrahydrodipicolinate reductase